METILSSTELGAAGRPTISSLANEALLQLRARCGHASLTTNPSAPSTPERDTLKMNMLRRIRPAPLKYGWDFYHQKRSTLADYEGRLTVMIKNIITIKTFWEVLNHFPLEALQTKDSVHFFKRGVKPAWEDPRNVAGGSWTFRVPKAQGAGFWRETLLLAVGEQFADALELGDELCGVSFSVRFDSCLVTIWNRDGSNQTSIDGILNVMLENISPNLKPKEGSWYYKKHSTRAGFNEVVAKSR